MKIICDNCRTKYSIADEKVKGKVFKIRCKKCSNIIVVHGNQAAESPDASQSGSSSSIASAGDYKDAPAWHLVINQQQVGPMTASEVRQRVARGEIDIEAYIWKEGFSDWMRISQVDEFAELANGASSSASSSPVATGYAADSAAPQQWNATDQTIGDVDSPAGDGDGGSPGGWNGGAADAWSAPADQPATDWGAARGDTGRTGQSNLFGGGHRDDDPARDLFATDQGQGYGAADGLAGAEMAGVGATDFAGGGGARGGGGNLFSQSAGAAEAGGELFSGGASAEAQQMFPAESESEPRAPQMTATRNENSVLFSLSNLQALAMGKPSSGAPSVSSAPVASSQSPAASPADGSGLIDIRSMAVGGGAPQRAGNASEAFPNLGGFGSPIAAAPVLMPYADEKKKWLLPAIIGGSALLIVLVTVLIVVLLTRKPDPVMVASAPVQQIGVPGGGVPTQPAAAGSETPQPGTASAGTAEPGAAGAAAATTEGKTVASNDTAEQSAGGRRRGAVRNRRTRRERPAASSRASEDQPAAARHEAPSKPGRKRDALDDLIDGAVGSKGSRSGRSRSAAASTAKEANLPQTLSRSDIQNGMRGIKNKVGGCYDRFKVPGLANVQVKISPSGAVTSAMVKGMFAGTPTGACVQAAAKSARFSRFSGSPITITYPFILR